MLNMDLANICRLCTKGNTRLVSIFGDGRLCDTHVVLDQIRDILRIEFYENDGLPQKICESCTTTMQKIQDRLDEFRENDAIMRKQLLEYGNIDVKVELNDTADASVGYSVKEVKIEVLDPDYKPSRSGYVLESEEWLEENYENYESESEEETEDIHGTNWKRKRTKGSIKVERLDVIECNELEETSARNWINGQVQTDAEKRVRKRRKDIWKDPNRPRLNDFKCYICRSEPLGSAKDLLDHLSTHIDQLPFTCKLCEQEKTEIKQIRSLNMHLKMHEQPIKCQYCDRRYANERSRDYHVQSFHLGDNAPCPTPCDVCGKVCPSLLSFRAHMKRHTVSFNCEYCAKGFAEKSKLKRHISRVHERTHDFECKICHKRMNTIDSYELHVRTIHEGRRDYECDICGRRFTTAAFLRMHHKHYEGGTCKPKNNWLPYYSTRISDEGIKLYTCKICGKGDMRSITEHLRIHFPEDYECPICFGKFGRKSSFDKHRLTHKEITHNCDNCEKIFLSPRKLARHMAKAHGDEQQQQSFSEMPVMSDEDEMVFDVTI
ncbi:zinc finger protein 658B-like [Toxorhynchites rutilus septentrionalis]|uniref:zinc finger protein 658B-like n=1 Tax=Toxorhynchites rutilus septentrionalis TaxID=329112 RepID=UPI002478F63B|nr:zinc finger protein 658B-like [Toxorhynchites rutilus septentrionalis]